MSIVRRNETLTPEQRGALDRAAADASASRGMAAFVGIFIGIGAFTAGTAAGARTVVQLLFGIVFTGAGLFVASQVGPRVAVFLLIALAIGLAVVGYRLGQRPSWRRSIRGAGSGGGGWIAGGGDGGSSSSSSSSSGGFGGGSSGGGGASGRW